MKAHVSYGFCAGNSPMAGSVGFRYEVAPTLRSGQSGTNMMPTVIYDVIVIDRAAFNQGANAQYIPAHRAHAGHGHAGCKRPARSLLRSRWWQ